MPDRIASASLTSLPAASQTSSVFKVLRMMGHGSAVHIGNGYVLTVAHVVEGANDPSLLGAVRGSDIVLKTLDGEALDVEVLWANTNYDVALLRSDDARRYPAAELSCRAPSVGTMVEVLGNPGPLEFARTWGACRRPTGLGWWGRRRGRQRDVPGGRHRIFFSAALRARSMICAMRDSDTISLRWSGNIGTSRRLRLPAQNRTGSAAGSMSTTTGCSSPGGSVPTWIALLQPLSIGKVTTCSSAGSSGV